MACECGAQPFQIHAEDCRVLAAASPGFITGDWSVEYRPVAEWKPIVREHFPAAAMRDSAI